MSIENDNDKLADNQALKTEQTSENIGHAHEQVAGINLPAKELLEQELLKRLSREKHRLAAEMEIKFKEAGRKRMQEQEQKFKQILAQQNKKYKELFTAEKQRLEAELKQKSNRVMKSMLHEREQKIADEYKQQHYAKEIELRNTVAKLEQELSQQKQAATLQIAEAKLTAKQEQEKASRNFYDNLVQASRNDIVRQTEEKLTADFLNKEAALKREHEIALKKHTAKLMNAYEEKLQQALYEQEQAFTNTNNEQLSRQSELFNHRIKTEIEAAVAAATSKLELEFVREKQALNAIIDNLRPEVEANRLRMRVEVEKELRDEFEVKFAQYKQKIDEVKVAELEALVTAEKQKLAEAMQEENMVVLRYKEREIREACTAEMQQDLQVKIQQNLQEQEKRLQAEHQQHLEQITKKLQAEHELQLQAEVIQERARISDKATNEKKILLQQQQANLEEKYQSEIAHKLAMQAQELQQQHQLELLDLEAKLQAAQSQQGLKQAYAQAMTVTEQNVAEPAPNDNVSEKQDFDLRAFEAEKQEALRAQEQHLRAQFAEQMRMAKETLQPTISGIELHVHEQALLDCEQRLRREFQAILEQQRMQAAANFAKQRDVEIRGSLARYKQKLLNELEMAKVNDLAAAEEALKEQFAARMQQHNELARVEIERTKEQLMSEQAEKIRRAVELQMEVVQKEQERKFAAYAQEQDAKLQALLEEEKQQLALRFAQDKANLIKDLTAKFTREKHIAMNKYETELREKLYKEMVKQKEFIQTKFTQAQDMALQEQKRRLDSQHKHEIERIKQGFFDPAPEFGKHDEIIVERNVEQLADKILAKFHK